MKRRWAWALLAGTTLVPLVVLAASHNQRSRFGAIVFPCLAMVFAGLSQMAQPRLLRTTAVAAVLMVGLGQVASQFPPGSDVQRSANVTIPTSGFGNVVLFAPYYPAANPAGDDATPVMQQIEAISKGRPVKVLVAQEDRVFNVYTLSWLAVLDHDPFRFRHPARLTGDPAELASYDLAVYLPAADVASRNADPRVSITRIQVLNQTTATTVYGDQLFKIFGRSRHRLTLEDGSTVWVLQR